MNLEMIQCVFKNIQNSIELPEYMKEVCSTFSIDVPEIRTLNKIVIKYDIESSITKVDFLHFVLEYIKIALQDDFLTSNERDNINYLKRLFKVKPGDFHHYHPMELQKLIGHQFSLIYNNDQVSSDEAMFKVNLQEIFDLSFDQMNEYSKKEAIISMKQGVSTKDLDVLFTHGEYSKLKSDSQNDI